MIVENLPNLAQAPPLWLLLATTLVGATEGAMIGRKPESDVDLVGMTIYAFFLGLGGALARDTLLGLPSAVIQSFWYPLMVLLGVLVALVLGLVLSPLSEALAALGCVGFVILSRVITLRWGVTTWRIKPLRYDS